MRNFICHWQWTFCLFLLTLVLVAGVAWKGVRVIDAAREAQQDMEMTVAAASELARDPGNNSAVIALAGRIDKLARSLQTLRAELQPLESFLGLARWLPSEASWMADVPDVLAVAAPVAQAGAIVARPFSAAASSDEPTKGRLSKWLAAVGSIALEKPELEHRLDEAETALARMRGRQLKGPLSRLDRAFGLLAEALPRLRQGLNLAEAVRPSLGFDGPRTYLLLGQNSAEIRATGGFIGSAGAVTVENGAVLRLDYDSSYTIDEGVNTPIPPAPLARYLGLGGWYLRDANWSPDFPTTASQVQLAWSRTGRDPADGVIAFDTATVKALLRVLGPVETPGFGQISADNFDQRAAEELYSPAALAAAGGFHQAKGIFVSAVGRALVERLLDLSPSGLLPLSTELLRLVEEKHIQLAFADQQVARIAAASSWDGAVPPMSGDSLFVVDTTVSYGDTYAFVRSEVSLRVDLREKSLGLHELVLTYNNEFPRGLQPWIPEFIVDGATIDPTTGKLQARPGFWGNWLRVYLPSATRVADVDGLSDPVLPWQESGRLVVAGYLPLAPGERRTVTVRYFNSAGKDEESGAYRLFLQKQAGLECRPTSITVVWSNGESTDYHQCPTRDQWVELLSSNVRGRAEALN